MSPSVVLLCGTGRDSIAVAHALHRELSLSGIVVQHRRPRRNLSAPKRLLFAILGPHRYELLASLTKSADERRVAFLEERLRKAADAYFRRQLAQAGESLPASLPAGVPVLQTPLINGPGVLERLQSLRPDLIVLYGVSIVKPPILATARVAVLNAHNSLLPAYRGSKVEFFQALEADYDNAGITIHRVDAGVDTGDIVFQKKNPIPGDTDPFMARASNQLLVWRHYPSVARAILEGRAARVAQPRDASRAYRAHELTLEARLRIYRRLQLLP
ncbi:MAG: hypothetical protein JWO05_1326 [Gemmatimonadetes bacterium]|nr:hypothetical protein [Gemmatimonadota bacterium]